MHRRQLWSDDHLFMRNLAHEGGHYNCQWDMNSVALGWCINGRKQHNKAKQTVTMSQNWYKWNHSNQYNYNS